MQEIANQVSTKRPVSANACGIETLEAPTFVLQAFRTVTGALFFLTAEPPAGVGRPPPSAADARPPVSMRWP